MNRPYWIEFLDKRMRTPRDNIMQDNLFILLSLLKMMVTARLCAIIYITICMSKRWLEVNCHILDYY